MDAYQRYSPIFRPRVVAVVGASSSAVTPGNEFIRHSRALGAETSGKCGVFHVASNGNATVGPAQGGTDAKI